MLPRFATFCSKMSSMAEASVLVRVRQQRQEARALDRRRQLPLVETLGAGDPARHDLAGLGHVVLERREILVVDHRHVVGREAAEFLAPREAGIGRSCHAYSLTADDSSSRSSKRSRLASPSSSARAIGEGSVTAVSTLVTRWRSTASLKRNAPVSSASVFWS